MQGLCGCLDSTLQMLELHSILLHVSANPDSENQTNLCTYKASSTDDYFLRHGRVQEMSADHRAIQ